MPFPGMPIRRTPAMQNCISAAMSDGLSREEAITSCHASVPICDTPLSNRKSLINNLKQSLTRVIRKGS